MSTRPGSTRGKSNTERTLRSPRRLIYRSFYGELAEELAEKGRGSASACRKRRIIANSPVQRLMRQRGWVMARVTSVEDLVKAWPSAALSRDPVAEQSIEPSIAKRLSRPTAHQITPQQRLVMLEELLRAPGGAAAAARRVRFAYAQDLRWRRSNYPPVSSTDRRAVRASVKSALVGRKRPTTGRVRSSRC